MSDAPASWRPHLYAGITVAAFVALMALLILNPFAGFVTFAVIIGLVELGALYMLAYLAFSDDFRFRFPHRPPVPRRPHTVKEPHDEHD